MPSLADLQTEMKQAIVSAPASALSSPLVGGPQPHQRLAIHRRHYQVSLVDTLLRRFPATQWLLGTSLFIGGAQEYVRRHPPTSPCMAEYGTGFGEFLADGFAANSVPWLQSFMELELMLGEVAICVDHPSCSTAALVKLNARELLEVIIELQPGLRYMRASWPVDSVIKLYLTEQAPSTYPMRPEQVHLQICGARGVFRIDRLSPGDFGFRQALALRRTAGQAAEQALEDDREFDVGGGLRSMVAEGLMCGFQLLASGPAHD